jgi:hypothetical protein
MCEYVLGPAQAQRFLLPLSSLIECSVQLIGSSNFQILFSTMVPLLTPITTP